MSKILIILIKFYKKYLSFDTGLLMFLAPGGACKYSPTCSTFSIQSIEKYGVLKGVFLSVKRIISCR